MAGKSKIVDKVYRKVGKRKVLLRPDEVDIAETKGWLMVEVTGWKNDGWVNMKLFRMAKAKKNVYYIGVNLEKMELGRSKDQFVLITHNPEIVPWVINSVKQYVSENRI